MYLLPDSQARQLCRNAADQRSTTGCSVCPYSNVLPRTAVPPFGACGAHTHRERDPERQFKQSLPECRVWWTPTPLNCGKWSLRFNRISVQTQIQRHSEGLMGPTETVRRMDAAHAPASDVFTACFARACRSGADSGLSHYSEHLARVAMRSVMTPDWPDQHDHCDEHEARRHRSQDKWRRRATG